MTKIETGQKAPEFELPDQDGKMHKLTDYRGKFVALYFYPKDATPGCTTEAQNFRDADKELQEHDVVILGVSKDSVESHKKFHDKENLSFPLLSDEDKTVINAYGSWGEKKFMGKTFEGVLRNTYLIDPDGNIAKVYEGVKPKEHVDEILSDIKNIKPH
jgi:peroxiredoxin Q/BCP